MEVLGGITQVGLSEALQGPVDFRCREQILRKLINQAALNQKADLIFCFREGEKRTRMVKVSMRKVEKEKRGTYFS